MAHIPLYPAVNEEGANSEEFTYFMRSSVKLPRKHRMRDQLGCIVHKKSKARRKVTSTRLLCSKKNAMEEFNKVTIDIRRFEVGTMKLLKGPVTFSVNYIKLPSKGLQVEASEITSCEWCTAQPLPALFLQTSSSECCRLRNQLNMSANTGAWYDCQSKNQEEKYIVIIFESKPTILQKAILEDIFEEIGKMKNVNFPTRLTFEEASDRLMAHKHSLRNEVIQLEEDVFPLIQPTSKYMLESVPVYSARAECKTTTLIVSDSEDDDDSEDQMDCSSPQTRTAKKLVVYPPPPATGGFSITEEDLFCLNEGEFLNDVILDFYLKYLVCEKLQKEDAHRFHVFSSFFYNCLTQNSVTEQLGTTELFSQETRHNRVKSWTRHLDIFEKDFIFVPINQSAHWFLAVICFPSLLSQCPAIDHSSDGNEECVLNLLLPNPMSLFYRHTESEQRPRWNIKDEMDKEFCFNSDDDDFEVKIQHFKTTTSVNVGNTASKRPCILIMDSLGCSAKPTVVKVLQEYLEMEWWVKKGSWPSFETIATKGWSVQVPTQDNNVDCGIYLLQYVESFIKNPPKVFHAAMDLRDWFPRRLVKKKRAKIKALILRLHRQQKFDLGD